MSLRVQKGGTVFRPMAKARPRAGPDDARQTSSTPDIRATVDASPSSGSTLSPEHARVSSSVPIPTSTPVIPHPQQHQPIASTSRSQLPQSDPNSSFASEAPVSQITRSGPSAPAVARHVGPPVQPPAPVTASARSSAAPPVAPPYGSQDEAPRVPTALQMAPPPVPPVQSLPYPQPPRTAPTQPHMIDPSLLPPGQTPAPHGNQQTDNASAAFPHTSGLDFVALIAQAARAANGDLPLAPVGPGLQEALDGPGSVQLIRPRRSKRTIAATEDADTYAEEDGHPVKRRRSQRHTGDLEEGDPKKRITRRGRRKSSTAVDDSNFDGSEAVDGEPRRKRRGRKPRSPVRFDADADPGEELDPTVVTMADLCEDTGQGRVSSKAAQIFENHANWKRANRERRARMRAISERKKYGLKEDEGEGEGEESVTKGETEEVVVPGSPPSAVEDDHSGLFDADGDGEEGGGDDDEFDYSAVGGGSRFAPRFRIGPNGETIIDETSLHVDRDEEAETAGYQHVEESDATKFTNSATYGKKVHGSRWSAEETEMFFDALRQFGENYELISYVLPGRDRKQCKNKFKAEDKKNSARIDECLRDRTSIDMDTLSRLTGKDFSGPTPVIRAKTPPNLAGMDPSAAVTVEGSPTVRKQSSTPGPSEKGGKRAGKKKSNAKADDGLEILGAVDGVWDSD